MATEKILNTRIINKHADLITKEGGAKGWDQSNLQLKEGEIALAKVTIAQHTGGTVSEEPAYLVKVGVEGKTFGETAWAYAKAADVYAWAKQQNLPIISAGEGNAVTNVEFGTFDVTEGEGDDAKTTKVTGIKITKGTTFVTSDDIKDYYTKEQTLEAVNKALADVSNEDTISNITTLVQYVNTNGSDLTTLISEVYGVTAIPENGESRIDTAVYNAGEALRIANEASAKVNTDTANAESYANQAAASAQAAADSALAAAGSAESAQEFANTATQKADEAADSADDALAAQAAAESAKGTAESAQQAAETAQELATQSKLSAEEARSAAETAQGLAEDAQRAAEEAQSKAEEAESDATEQAQYASQYAAEASQYKFDAESAKESAETAQGYAEDAQEVAQLARDEAVEAKEAALASNTSATAIANEAKATADEAKALADTALQQVVANDTEDVPSGIKVTTKANNEQKISIDDSITWIFDCGGAE